MRRKLLFAIVALMCSVGTWAVELVPTASTYVVGQSYYLYNPVTKQFLKSDDGTPYVKDEGDAWTIVASDKEGYVKIRLKTDENGYFWGKYWAIVGANYSDYLNETYMKLEGTNSQYQYKIHSFAWNGTNTAYVYINTDNGNRVAANSQEQNGLNEDYTIWEFITEENYALYKSGLDFTAYIVNPNAYVDVNGWTSSNSAKAHRHAGNGYDGTPGFFELCDWENTWTLSLSQTVNDLPNGVYKVQVAGQMSDSNTEMKLIANKGYAYFSANGDTNGNVLADGTETTIGAGVAGWRYNNVICMVSDGKLELKIEGTATVKNRWANFDNVTLTKLNPSSTNPIEITSYGYITNPSFESDASGWTNNGMVFQTNTAFSGKAGSKYAEVWQPNGTKGIKQTISGLPNGMYRITAPILARGVTSARFFAAGISKAVTIADAVNTYSIDFYSDGTDVEIGFEAVGTGAKESWICIDDFKLYSLGSDNSAFSTQLTEIADYFKANVVDVLPTSPVKTSMTTLYNEKKTASDNASYMSNMRQLSTWKNVIPNNNTILAAELSAAAQVTAEGAYEETTSGAHETYVDAVAAHATAVASATSASGITTANNALTAAIKTYLNGVKPANDGEYIEITSLVVNPSFTVNTIDGWTRELTQGTTGNAVTSWTCNEFYNNTFDFYQTLTGLPSGSYGLSVQAYSRPGGNDVAYPAYKNGTNNVTAELYVNSDASRVGNIYSYTGNTTGAKVSGNDYHCTAGDDNYWVPNNMQGASLYFEGGENYKTEVAALVEDGTLRIGFRDATLTSAQWTIFDNFRLFYYGSDKSIYLKQYLPQLEAEVAANFLNNGAYAILKEGQAERVALAAANAADASSLSTEEELQNAISAITTARDNFEAAKTAYENLNATITAANAYKNNNVGTGVFQITIAAGETLSGKITTAQGVHTTGTASKSDVETAIETLNAAVNVASITLNAPADGARYYLKVATSGHAKENNAIVVSLGSTSDNNPTGYGFAANASPAAHIAGAYIFTPVPEKASNYYISVVRPEGNVYLTYGSLNGSAAGWKTQQIQGTTNADNKGEFKIVATSTANVFNIVNTVFDGADNYIDCQDGGSLYTDTGIDKKDFSLAEASEASVELHIAAGKLATRIFPFTPTLPEGVEAYSCAANNGASLTLEKVNAPEANKPYILYSENEVQSTELKGWGTATADEYTEGYLTGVYTNAVVPAGSYVLQTPTSGDNAGVQAFYMADGEGKSSAYRAYVTVPAETPQNGVKMFTVNLEELSDAIKTARSAGETTIRYNLAGQRVSDAQKGIVIVNGKKVLVK